MASGTAGPCLHRAQLCKPNAKESRLLLLIPLWLSLSSHHPAQFRTKVGHKTLNPVWNEEFHIAVSGDSLLQSEPVEFRVMDHDVYTTDDRIGVLHVELSPLLMRNAQGDSGDTIGSGGAGGGVGESGGGDSGDGNNMNRC